LQCQARVEREAGHVEARRDRLVEKAQAHLQKQQRLGPPWSRRQQTKACVRRYRGSHDPYSQVGKAKPPKDQPKAEEARGAKR
jgi:hypothetical protein